MLTASVACKFRKAITAGRGLLFQKGLRDDRSVGGMHTAGVVQ